MNKKFWNLYKADSANQEVISLFDASVEDEFEGMKNIFDYSVKWGGDKFDDVNADLYLLLSSNITSVH